MHRYLLDAGTQKSCRPACKLRNRAGITNRAIDGCCCPSNTAGHHYARQTCNQHNMVTLHRRSASSAVPDQPRRRAISNTARAMRGAFVETYIMSAVSEKLSTRARDTNDCKPAGYRQRQAESRHTVITQVTSATHVANSKLILAKHV